MKVLPLIQQIIDWKEKYHFNCTITSLFLINSRMEEIADNIVLSFRIDNKLIYQLDISVKLIIGDKQLYSEDLLGLPIRDITETINESLPYKVSVSYNIFNDYNSYYFDSFDKLVKYIISIDNILCNSKL